MTPPNLVKIDNFDIGPDYDVLYIHILNSGIFVQKGDSKVKINILELAEILALLPVGIQVQ